MKIGRYRIGYGKTDTPSLGFYKYPLFFVKWGFSIGKFYVEKFVI